MAAGGRDADVREERTWHENLGCIGSVKFYLSLENEQTCGVRSWKINWKETSDFFHCLFLFPTFYRISEYSHGDEIRPDKTLMVPLSNLSNTNLCMLVSIPSARALCFSVINLKWCFYGNNVKL